jgi:hypothetical protein
MRKFNEDSELSLSNLLEAKECFGYIAGAIFGFTFLIKIYRRILKE